MIINADLTQAPDVRPSISSGIYEWQILKVEAKPPKKAETRGIVLHIDVKLINNAEFEGRNRTYYCFIPSDANKPDAYTPLKRLFMAAGVEINKTGMDTNLLVGRVISIPVVSRTFTDEAGVTKITDDLGDVLIPSERAGKTIGGGASASSVSVADVIGSSHAPEPAAVPA